MTDHFADFLEQEGEFLLTTFRKPSGRIAFVIEGDEKAVFEAYQNIVLRMKLEEAPSEVDRQSVDQAPR